jgi:teichuronic acid biosynthesis glycosyltransferase TuaH
VRIVLGGYYGEGNLGDELLLRIITERLKAAGHHLAVVSLDPGDTQRRHGLAAIDRGSLAELIRQIQAADAFMLGGGGLFQDHHQFTRADLRTFPARSVSHYAQLCLLARELSVPYLLFGMGVGPLYTDDARAITKDTFEHAAYASVRDEASLELLREIGVGAPVDCGADPAWLAPAPKRDDLSRRFPQLAGRRVLVVAVREWPFADGWQAGLVAMLREAVRQGCGLLWLPFQARNDRLLIPQLMQRIGEAAPQAIADWADPADAEGLIAAADGLVAMRLHALILGLKNGVRTLTLEYDPKLEAVAAAVGLPAVQRLALADPPARFMEAIRNLSQWAPPPAEVAARVATLRDRAGQSFAALERALGQLPARRPLAAQGRWIAEWVGSQVDDLSERNRRLEAGVEAVRSTWAARLLRAEEIVRAEGWIALARRAYRVLIGRPLGRLGRALLRRPARRRLAQILRQHAGKTPMVLPTLVPWRLPLFQRPHQLARELAARDFLYFFCVPWGAPDRVYTFAEVAPGCFVTPHEDLVVALPHKIVHLLSTDNIRSTTWVRQRLASGDRVLYEYIDEIHADISGERIPADTYDKHRYLLRNEEVACVATADALDREVRASRSRNRALVTNGVDLTHFAARPAPGPVPRAMQDVVGRGRPVVGYFGALAKWFDYGIVRHLAERRPTYDIVLIGPMYDDSSSRQDMQGLPNVRLLGPVDYAALPDYARLFDVALIPFLLNDITASTSPIKLFEYMALGLPIVATDMPECRKYRSVLIGRDPGHFIEQVDRALALRDDARYMATLREEAVTNSWSAKAGAIVDLLRASGAGPA